MSYYGGHMYRYEYDLDDLTIALNQLTISQKRRQKVKSKGLPLKAQLQQPELIIRNPCILNINQYPSPFRSDYSKINDVLTYTYPDKRSSEYQEIKNLFVKHGLVIKLIRKVNNPFLKKAFEMKMQFDYGNMQPQRLFHGTKRNYVDSICTYNFNWRYSGKETGHKHGKGVNFSKNAIFATFFCDKGIKKVIIVADVLIKKVTNGSENLLVPPRGFDTTEGKQGRVLVKFYDNEFCPTYVVDCLKIKRKN